MDTKVIQDIKRIVIRALVSDDDIMSDIVLKGGSAIELFYNPRKVARFSGDLDFSLINDFVDLEDTRSKIESLLVSEFSGYPFSPIDVKLESPVSSKTENAIPAYILEFKIITPDNLSRAGINPLRKSKMAFPLFPGSRKFTVDFSGNEFSDGFTYQDVDGFTVQVYTPVMLVCEKLRAICQQMSEYKNENGDKSHIRGRARDFFDIHLLVSSYPDIMLNPDFVSILSEMFKVKRVSLSNLLTIPQYYQLHLSDEVSLKATAPSATLKSFKFYFDFVVTLVTGLEIKI